MVIVLFYVMMHLNKVLLFYIMLQKINLKCLLKFTYEKSNHYHFLFHRKPVWKDGTTALLVLLINETMYIANIGDSQVPSDILFLFCCYYCCWFCFSIIYQVVV